MNGRGGHAPPSNGGEFLLQLLRQPPNSNPPTQPPSHHPPQQTFPPDPAVAAVGPSIPTFHLPHAPPPPFPSDGHDSPYATWNHSTPPPIAPHQYFVQNPNPNLNPNFNSPPRGFNYAPHQFNHQPNRPPPPDDARKLGSYRENHQQVKNIIFGSHNRDNLPGGGGDFSRQSSNRGIDNRRANNGFPMNPIEANGNARGNLYSGNSKNRMNKGDNGSQRAVAPPPGFSTNVKNVKNREYGRGKWASSDYNVDKAKGDSGDVYKNARLSNQLESSSGCSVREESSPLADGSRVSAFDFEGKECKQSEKGDLDQLVGALTLEDESNGKRVVVAEDESDKKHHHDKDYRSDNRGKWIMGQRMRNLKSRSACRSDINRLNGPFLEVFELLIPADEEKVKQKQLLSVLEKLVGQEWPEARLYLYGSCANSFGFSKSDIDVCLAMDLGDSDKSEVLLKLADILQSDNLQNVQALTRARVPVVKLMDPITGISCDICVNNVLAVINTKLLRDYANIDIRLRQLAFIVKHWAKSRGVNETYHGTLSSYAYVLMCIHFLQQRRPAILPCLQQGMEITYFATVENVDCAYFDQVEKLQDFGSRNGESIAQLVWAFFHYWAYCHDYANDVISVRTGSTLSKRAKDWTRRVGNDRHLICIEDPFEVSHDLGRVVDKYSIRVLREEFERAAEIMEYDSNPCVTLFEPYSPN